MNPLKFNNDVDLKEKEVFKTKWEVHGSQILLARKKQGTQAQKQEHLDIVNSFFSHLNRVLDKVLDLEPKTDDVKDIKGQLNLFVTGDKDEKSGDSKPKT